jgi:hypothetical protein
MKTQDNNPTIAPTLRWTYVFSCLLLFAAGSMYFIPEFVVSRWPWPLAPFNARFLGTVYLVELIGAVIVVVTNRWAPTRLVLPVSFIFSGGVTLVSFLYLDRFDYQKPATWVWFVAYILGTAVFGFYLWSYRSLPPADPTPVPSPWRAYLLVQGVVLVLYGVGMFLAPAAFSSFWPWKIDDFHAQIYSPIFVALGAGSLVMSRAGARIEFLTLGVTQAVFGSLAILGLVIVDASARRVDWSSPDTWLWVAGFAVLFVAGVAMVWWAYAKNPARAEVPTPTG